MLDQADLRRAMVLGQLRPHRIDDDAVLAAMLEVPREAFLPPRLQGVAYSEGDLELGGGRRLLQPLMVARLLQTAEVRSTDHALVIGCDTGYAAALLARFAGRVTLLQAAGAPKPVVLPGEGGAAPIDVVTGDLALGLPKAGPFAVVLAMGSVPAPPPALLAQLAPLGRLVTVVREGTAGRLARVRRLPTGLAVELLESAFAPELEAFRKPQHFTL